MTISRGYALLLPSLLVTTASAFTASRTPVTVSSSVKTWPQRTSTLLHVKETPDAIKSNETAPLQDEHDSSLGDSSASSLVDLAASTVEAVSTNFDELLSGEDEHSEGNNEMDDTESAPSMQKLSDEKIHKAVEDENDGSSGIFDITGSLFDSDSPGFWSNIISFSDGNDNENSGSSIFDFFSSDGAEEKGDKGSKIGGIASFEEGSRTWMEMIRSADHDSISNIIAKAQDIKWQDEANVEKTSLLEIHEAIQHCATGINAGFRDFLGDQPVPIPSVSSLQYYFERTEEVKTPSWKRRVHRFFPKIKASEVEHLNQKLQLARLAYADTVEEIRETLRNEYDCELLYCDTEAKPNKPAHFLAVKWRQSKWRVTDSLDVYLVVCGTRTVIDIITDLICEATPYRDGYAHAGMTESGKYLAEKHIDLLRKLRDESGRNQIKVHMLGHSLGAGCAASKYSQFSSVMKKSLTFGSQAPKFIVFCALVTAMEWNDFDFIDLEMTGFGCPALVSKNLADASTSFITSVIADNDCVPRLSLASLLNALLDVTQFDYTQYAKRDLNDVMDEIETFLPNLLTGAMDRDKIMRHLDSLLPDKESFHTGTRERMEVILRPPGTAIHFFFDGFGITGCRVGTEFFTEMDINRRMVHDHLFDSGYNRILLETMRQHLNDNNFSFQTKEQRNIS